MSEGEIKGRSGEAYLPKEWDVKPIRILLFTLDIEEKELPAE